MSECSCGPGGAPRPTSQRGPHKKGCPKRTGVRRRKDGDGDDSMKEADGDWVMEPSPERPPKTIRVIAERRKTPSGKHTEVELNAYDGVTHLRETANAPLLMTLGRKRREASDGWDPNKRLRERNYEGKKAKQLTKRLQDRGQPPRPAKSYTFKNAGKRASDANHEARAERVLAAFGSRERRQSELRARDDILRREIMKDGPWPPPSPDEMPALSRLKAYFEHLDGLRQRIFTCSNCKQKDVCAGVDRGGGMCNFFRSSPEGHHWENGLDLELSPTSAETMADATARARWADLVRRHHPLSPVEEALISPVSACFSVLKLPSGGQLGFRGKCYQLYLRCWKGVSRSRVFNRK